MNRMTRKHSVILLGLLIGLVTEAQYAYANQSSGWFSDGGGNAVNKPQNYSAMTATQLGNTQVQVGNQKAQLYTTDGTNASTVAIFGDASVTAWPNVKPVNPQQPVIKPVNPTPSPSKQPKPPTHCIPGSLGYYGCPVPKPKPTGVTVTQTDESEQITMSTTTNPPSSAGNGTQVVY